MRRTSRCIGAIGVTGALLFAGGTPASGTGWTKSVALACRATTPIGVKYVTTAPTAVGAAAADTVVRGAITTERLFLPPMPVPRDLGGYPLTHVRGIKLRFRVGTAGTIERVRLVGGASPGATASVSGRVVTVSAPAAVPSGSTLRLPDAVVDVRATGPRQASIVTDVPGTSYDDWTVQLTARVHYLGDHDIQASCFAKPMATVLAKVLIV